MDAGLNVSVAANERHTEGEGPQLLPELIREYCESFSTDLFMYSGVIWNAHPDQFVDIIINKNERRDCATLFLTTYGGNPHQAFKMARSLKAHYAHWKVLVVGPCKSAGTLLVVGANEVVFGAHGELGPLDMQLLKPDEIARLSSGLDTMNAFESLKTRTFDSFLDFVLSFIGTTDAAISTTTACEVATKLTAGLVGPIAGQIDPYRLGEVSRSMEIGKEYAKRLASGSNSNISHERILQLIEGYPSHSFVIDEEEAKEIFRSVRHVNELESRLFESLRGGVRDPQKQAIVMDLEVLASVVANDGETETDDERDCSCEEDANPEPDDDGGASQPGGNGKEVDEVIGDSPGIGTISEGH